MLNRLAAYAKLACCVLGLLMLATPAQAGFQWVAPPAPPPAPPAPIVPLLPTPSPSEPVVQTPSESPSLQPVTGSPVQLSPLPSSSEAGLDALPLVVVGGGGTPGPVILHAPPHGPRDLHQEEAAPMLAAAPMAPVVHGFAKNVPLAVALRQILPSGYGFSVDPDVDLGVSVSFKGGKSWAETLRTALAPVGLVYREQGQMVTISRMGAGPAPVAMMAPPPPLHVLTPPPQSEMLLPSSVAVSSTPVWKVENGQTLRKTLELWCRRQGVELNWRAEYDYPIQASMDFTGSFEDAVRNLLTGFENTHPQPIAELHNNKNLGQNVLIVNVRGQ